jgi:hypothetical protein
MILALDLHHIIEVNEDGPNEAYNLIVLCANCHAMYTRKMISAEAINVYKTMLVTLNQAFDKETISTLLFLKKVATKSPHKDFAISADGVLKFTHLIASGLADYEAFGSGPRWDYLIHLTDKGNRIIDAWFSGNRDQVRQALNDIALEENNDSDMSNDSR